MEQLNCQISESQQQLQDVLQEVQSIKAALTDVQAVVGPRFAQHHAPNPASLRKGRYLPHPQHQNLSPRAANTDSTFKCCTAGSPSARKVFAKQPLTCSRYTGASSVVNVCGMSGPFADALSHNSSTVAQHAACSSSSQAILQHIHRANRPGNKTDVGDSQTIIKVMIDYPASSAVPSKAHKKFVYTLCCMISCPHAVAPAH
jgi:hypothetical protein